VEKEKETKPDILSWRWVLVNLLVMFTLSIGQSLIDLEQSPQTV
jgi:hypothetical protein